MCDEIAGHSVNAEQDTDIYKDLTEIIAEFDSNNLATNGQCKKTFLESTENGLRNERHTRDEMA